MCSRMMAMVMKARNKEGESQESQILGQSVKQKETEQLRVPEDRK